MTQLPIFIGGGLTSTLKQFIDKIDNFQISEEEYIKNSLPLWLYNKIHESFNINTKKVCQSMFDEAHFDIRVKKGISRKNIINKFKNYNIKSDITPISPIGVRINKRLSVSNLKEFKEGLFEVQDEGSQLVSLMSGVKENETVIDLCAGAGGKSLAISDLLENVKIIATDININRLDKIRERALRFKVKNKTKIVSILLFSKVTGPQLTSVTKHFIDPHNPALAPTLAANLYSVDLEAEVTKSAVWKRE